MREEEIGAYRSLMDALEKRAALLDVLAQRLDPRRPFARVGEELEQPGLRELALVGATYGFAHRTLGAVSLLGPLRMDYEKALRSVRVGRARAVALRRRGLRGRLMATTDRDYYELLGVPRDADDATIKKAFRRLARELHPDVSDGAGRRGALPRGDRGVRGAVELRDARALRPLRPRRAPLGRLHADALRHRRARRPVRDVLRRRHLRRREARALAGAARTSRRRSRSSSSTRRAGIDGRRAVRGRRPVRDVRRRRRRARARSRSRAPAATAPGRLQQVSRSVFGEFVRTQACPQCGGARPDRRAPVQGLRGRRARRRGARTLDVEVPPGIHDGQRIRVSRRRSCRRARRPRRATCTCSSTSIPIRASCARATTSTRRST